MKFSPLVIGVVAVITIIGLYLAFRHTPLQRVCLKAQIPFFCRKPSIPSPTPPLSEEEMMEDIPVPLITESVRKSVYNGF